MLMTDNRVALVTGANKGIGFEICRQLAREGLAVLLGARDEAAGTAAAAQLTAEGLDVRFVLIDMEKPETFDSARELIDAEFGKLDVLVNNAAISLEMGQTADSVSPDMIRQTFDVNFFALIDLTQRLLPLIRKSPEGRIVNQSSVLGSLTVHSQPRSPLEGLKALAYNSSKSALNAFTVHLADALKDTPIKVNSAHPGNVKTDMNPWGTLSLEEGAKTAVDLALLPDDGPTGGFFFMEDRLPW